MMIYQPHELRAHQGQNFRSFADRITLKTNYFVRYCPIYDQPARPVLNLTREARISRRFPHGFCISRGFFNRRTYKDTERNKARLQPFIDNMTPQNRSVGVDVSYYPPMFDREGTEITQKAYVDKFFYDGQEWGLYAVRYRPAQVVLYPWGGPDGWRDESRHVSVSPSDVLVIQRNHDEVMTKAWFDYKITQPEPRYHIGDVVHLGDGLTAEIKCFRANPHKPYYAKVLRNGHGIGYRSIGDADVIAPDSVTLPSGLAVKMKITCTECGERSDNETTLCNDCTERKAEYDDKRAARAERLQARADKKQAEAQAYRERSDKITSFIPMGQPILVGHHSEGRHRRDLAKSDKLMRKSFEAQEQAQTLSRRAERAESNRAIMSDDPTAITQLKDKLAKLESTQENLKRVNKSIRKVVKALPDTDEIKKHRARLDEMMGWHKVYTPEEKTEYDALRATISALLVPLRQERAAMLTTLEDLDLETCVKLFTPVNFGYDNFGIPSYRLRNNGAEIRRTKKRIAELETVRTTPVKADEETDNGIKILRDKDDNRIRLVFPGKPSEEVRAILKAQGFRWSPRNKAWQRHLNNAGENAVIWALEKINKLPTA